MPIRPEMKHLYPPKKEWEELRAARLKVQHNECLWCHAPNGRNVIRKKGTIDWRWDFGAYTSREWRKVKIVLTIAHLNHDPTDNRPENTPALCQLCHNRHDAKHRARERVRREDERKIKEWEARVKS
jgi:hypothetical protein